MNPEFVDLSNDWFEWTKIKILFGHSERSKSGGIFMHLKLEPAGI